MYSVTTEEKFYVVPSESLEVLEIDRLNFDLKLISKLLHVLVS